MGLNIPCSLGQANPSSSMVNGCGPAPTSKVGETIMSSAVVGGGTVGTGESTPVIIPTLRRRLASMMRRVSA